MSKDVIEIFTVGGKARCIYVNDYRVAGGKPYVSENPVIIRFEVEAGEIRKHLKRKARSNG